MKKTKFFGGTRSLSWYASQRNLHRLQKRVFRSVLVGDTKIALQIQKLIFQSNSARLLSIRQVTQLSQDRKVPGIDGKISLTFSERSELNEFLRLNCNNWNPQKLLNVPTFSKNGATKLISIPTVADRCWYCLIGFTIEPSSEALFHPRNFGFRKGSSPHQAHRAIFLNLNLQSYGAQKRLIKVNLLGCFSTLSLDIFMKKVLAPRIIKLGIFRSLKIGLRPNYSLAQRRDVTLSSVLGNIALLGIEDIHPCIKFGFDMVLLLKPNDNEKFIIRKFYLFLSRLGMFIDVKNFNLVLVHLGFDFLGWNFKVQRNGKFLSTPSRDSFHFFQTVTRHIINNSNFGAKIKAVKLSPIVFKWRMYNRFCNMDSSRYSLFFLQRQAFKVFNKEAKQDRFSSKRLLNKAFPIKKCSDNNLSTISSLTSIYFGHTFFWRELSIRWEFIDNKSTLRKSGCYFCSHCGLTKKS